MKASQEDQRARLTVQVDDGFFNDANALSQLRSRIFGMGFMFDANPAGETHLAEGDQDFGDIECTLSNDNVLIDLVVVVLQVDAVVPRSHGSNLLSRIEIGVERSACAPNQMAGI